MEVAKKVVFIKDWILNYVNSMPVKAQSLIVGISGGIDSSVTSTLCAMTGLKTIVLTMPIKQSKEQNDLSLLHKRWLNDKFKNVESYSLELDNVFKNFENTLLDFKSEHGMANSRARLRMTCLLYTSPSPRDGLLSRMPSSA